MDGSSSESPLKKFLKPPTKKTTPPPLSKIGSSSFSSSFSKAEMLSPESPPDIFTLSDDEYDPTSHKFKDDDDDDDDVCTRSDGHKTEHDLDLDDFKDDPAQPDDFYLSQKVRENVGEEDDDVPRENATESSSLSGHEKPRVYLPSPPMPSFSEHKRMMELQREENEKTASLPSMKVINSPPFGFWIADDNRLRINVFDDKLFDQLSIEHSIFAGPKEIPGRIFKKPRIVVLRLSPLIQRLNYSADNRSMLKDLPYVRNFESDPSQRYLTCRAHLIFLLDDENNFLHERPIQLTAKGCFSISFHKKFSEFVNSATELLKIKDFRINPYLNGWKQTVQEPCVPRSDKPASWTIAQLVFCPIFKAGQSADRTKQSVFCECVGFQKLDERNVGHFYLDSNDPQKWRKPDQLETILFKEFWERDGWWAGRKQLQNAQQQ